MDDGDDAEPHAHNRFSLIVWHDVARRLCRHQFISSSARFLFFLDLAFLFSTSTRRGASNWMPAEHGRITPHLPRLASHSRTALPPLHTTSTWPALSPPRSRTSNYHRTPRTPRVRPPRRFTRALPRHTHPPPHKDVDAPPPIPPRLKFMHAAQPSPLSPRPSISRCALPATLSNLPLLGQRAQNYNARKITCLHIAPRCASSAVAVACRPNGSAALDRATPTNASPERAACGPQSCRFLVGSSRFKIMCTRTVRRSRSQDVDGSSEDVRAVDTSAVGSAHDAVGRCASECGAVGCAVADDITTANASHSWRRAPHREPSQLRVRMQHDTCAHDEYRNAADCACELEKRKLKIVYVARKMLTARAKRDAKRRSGCWGDARTKSRVDEGDMRNTLRTDKGDGRAKLQADKGGAQERLGIGKGDMPEDMGDDKDNVQDMLRAHKSDQRGR
ncbi:hypothetical protein C8R45DRAFT_1209312 [Mycena sanguinolenta]|nr:hypothetical protein C8R45DRAFT_1209312 [Mycena sanguinolenta]